MKKFCTILFALSASLCLFVSCEEEPVASFSVSSTLVGTNQNVSFTNTSVDADNFEWYFGDGASSTEANPTHSYSKQGNYIVTLIAYSKSGRMLDDAYKAYIWVLDPYKVVFHNPTYTPIRITVTDYGTQTIPIDGSTIFEVYTSTPSFTASATETFSNGNPLALTVSWQGTLELTNPTSDINLNIGTNIFYLYTKNTSGYDLGPIYSNYGTSYQVYINALLPTSIATWYGLGYHHARYNTQIRWYYSSTYYYYATAGTDFSFPDTNNQSLAITVGSKSNEIGVEKQSHGTDLNTAFEFKTFQDTKNTSVKILGSIDIFPVNQ